MEQDILRGFERILVVCIAGLSVYLGFLMFKAMPERTEGEGKISLPGGISIFVSRVGPGVFFALFGALVVVTSLRSPLEHRVTTKEVRQVGESVQARETEYHSSQFGQTSRSPESLDLARTRVQSQISFLNRLGASLRDDLAPKVRQDIDQSIKSLKMELIFSVWGNWGEHKAFEDWVNGGGTGAPPEQLREATDLYRFGSGGKS